MADRIIVMHQGCIVEEKSELALLLDQMPIELQQVFIAPTVEECDAFSLINQAEINIENNTWNATNLAPGSYEQCIYQYNIIEENWVGWKWSYPDIAEGINAYPQLIYGKKPWHSGSTTTALPVEIDQIERLKAQYAVAISRNEGEYNLAFDNWISSAASSRPEEIQFEFMIQMLLPLMGPMISIQANLPGSQRGRTGPILPLFEQAKEQKVLWI